MFLYVVYNNNVSISIALERFTLTQHFPCQRKLNFCTFTTIYTHNNLFAHTLVLNCFVLHF